MEVAVPWIPVRCSTCGNFGHPSKGCFNQQPKVPEVTKEWRQKKQSVTEKVKEGAEVLDVEGSVVNYIEVSAVRGKEVVVSSPVAVIESRDGSSPINSINLLNNSKDAARKQKSSGKKKNQGKGGSENMYCVLEDDEKVSRVLEE